MNIGEWRRGRARGFTLIELLIVVAIIAILAAIAVPNFLQAQTRSKVSRVASDMRTLAVALEAYFVDWNAYPRDHDNFESLLLRNRFLTWNLLDPSGPGWSIGQVGWYYLTTPVAYITTLANDPFVPEGEVDDAGPGDYFSTHYVFSSGSDAILSDSSYEKAACYFMNSIGPDKIDDTGNQDHFPYGGAGDFVQFYDPTNGTISAGDLYRFGGNFRQGNWHVDVDYDGATDTGTRIPWYEWTGPIPH